MIRRLRSLPPIVVGHLVPKSWVPSIWVPALLVLALLMCPADAEAHGRFPAAGMVIIDPSDDAHIWVRATYGIVTTDDGGASWSWICPEAVGPQGMNPGYNAATEDPIVQFTSDGSVLAGIFDGLAVTRSGCDWSMVSDAGSSSIAGRAVVDLRPERDRAHTVALSTNGIAARTFEVNLWESADDGRTWAHLGIAPPTNFFARSLGVAESDPQRLYLAGRDSFVLYPGLVEQFEGALFRSDDRGQSWTRHPIPGVNSEQLTTFPYLAAVHPDDPDTVFVQSVTNEGVDIISTQLLLSRDGGGSWQVVYERPHTVAGFSLSPDGSQVAVGSEKDGLWIAPLQSLDFEKVSPIHVRCLTWHTSGLFACADEFTDGYTVGRWTGGRSSDGDVIFEPLMNLGSPCGPPSCGGETAVGVQCVSRWPAERIELDAKVCDAPPAVAPEDGSCSCRSGPRPSDDGASWPSWLLALGLATWLRRPLSTRSG
jgi:photosystem II stability/assembly factor-like uncharacterized protein